jgi:hypothetical protein
MLWTQMVCLGRVLGAGSLEVFMRMFLPNTMCSRGCENVCAVDAQVVALQLQAVTETSSRSIHYLTYLHSMTAYSTYNSN